jgi:membrane-bound lytic murein transglycosylase D
MLPLLVVLAGCASLAPRGQPAEALAPVSDAPLAGQQGPDAPSAEVPKVDADGDDTDPWARIRAGARITRCDAPESTRRWIARLRHDGPALQRQLVAALPQIDFVLDPIERAGLPSEFALLPLVESGYRALPANGNRPAGIWQFMPITGRDLGLRIGASHDARLDLVASTDAAVRLLTRLAESFDGDWLLANMAFNTGEYRLRRALARAPGARADNDWQGLAVSPVTRAHLARLLALSCIVHDPAAAGIALPRLAPEDRLASLVVTTPVDLALVAYLADLPPEQVRRHNPAQRRANALAGDRLVLPVPALARLEHGLSRLPEHLRTGWRTTPAPAGSSWQDLATAQVDAATLAALHGVGVGDPPPATLLLPRTQGTAHGIADDGTAYVVRAGDNLWLIARRLGIGLQALAKANGLRPGRLLHPGQVLRLPPAF